MSNHKNPVGRPNLGAITKNLTLDSETIRLLTEIDKNLSKAVRIAAKHYHANPVDSR